MERTNGLKDQLLVNGPATNHQDAEHIKPECKLACVTTLLSHTSIKGS